MPERICLDASVAAKWVFPEVHSEEAKEIQRDVADGRTQIVVPDSFFIECVSAVYHKQQQSLADMEQAQAALGILRQVPANVTAVRDVSHQTIALADRLNITVWDAAYLAVAEHHNCELWTADKKLARQTQPHFDWVKLLGTDEWTEAR